MAGGEPQVGWLSLREHRAYIEGLGSDFDPNAFMRSIAGYGGMAAGCEFDVLLQAFNASQAAPRSRPQPDWHPGPPGVGRRTIAQRGIEGREYQRFGFRVCYRNLTPIGRSGTIGLRPGRSRSACGESAPGFDPFHLLDGVETEGPSTVRADRSEWI